MNNISPIFTFRERNDVLETFPQIMDYTKYGANSEDELEKVIPFSKLNNMVVSEVVHLNHVTSDDIDKLLVEIPKYIEMSLIKFPDKDISFDLDIQDKIAIKLLQLTSSRC